MTKTEILFLINSKKIDLKNTILTIYFSILVFRRRKPESENSLKRLRSSIMIARTID